MKLMANEIHSWPRLRAIGVFAVNLGLLAAGLFSLGLGCFQAFLGNQSMATTCLGAGLILLLASSIDRFEMLKGFGIEAKTRALSRVLSEADSALIELKLLAEITGRSIVALTSGAGRVGSAPTIRSNAATIDEVRTTLQRVKTDPAKIREILQPWVRITLFDASRHLTTKIRSALTVVQTNATAEALTIPSPRSPEDQIRYDTLIAKAQAAATFNQNRVGEPGTWPTDSYEERFGRIIVDMPIDEDARAALRNELAEWGPRFTYLHVEQQLRDPEAWFALPR